MSTNSKRSRRTKRQPNNRITVDRLLASSHHSAGKANVLQVAADFARRVPSWALTQSPPKNINSQIYWVQTNSDNGLSISSAVPTFLGQTFQATDSALTTALCASFDQYCIYAVYIRLTMQGAFGGTYSGTVVTCFDYDSVAALGSYSAYLQYNSADECPLTSPLSIERFLKPCVAAELYTGSVAGAYGVTRSWIDSASTSIPHYGFRAAFTGNVNASLVVTVSWTSIFGFRNSF
jgi:hypothetical protein